MKERDKTAKPILRAIAGEPLDRPPLWLMRQAGRYLPEYRELRQRARNFLEFCLTPERAVEATLQPIRRFGFDAAILFSDILVVPHALGQAVGFREGEGPVLEKLVGRAALAGLQSDGLVERLAPVYETVTQVRTMLPAESALIGFAGAPWTVATYMVEGGSSRDFATVKSWAFADAEGFAMLLDILIEATIAHLKAQIAAGAELVQLFESWAGVLGGEAFERCVIAPTRQIVAAVKATYPHIPVIGFPRGAGLNYRHYVEATGVDAISLDATVPLAIARETLQRLAAVQGNLDPICLLAGGAALEHAVDAIVTTLGSGGFIFNLGHGVLPQTPVEHVARLVELVRRRS